MQTVFIGVGSNVGNREENIEQAIHLLDLDPAIEIIAVSSLIETDPVGGPPQGKYINGVLRIKTTYQPYPLLRKLQGIERQLGRIRGEPCGPRTIDLDILLYGTERVDEEDLQIPHPRMHERAFVLEPLFEIAPELRSEIKGFKGHTTQGHKVTRLPSASHKDTRSQGHT